MKVIDYLNAHGVNGLVRDKAIHVREHKSPYQNLMVLNYDQINSPKNDEITMLCRNLIVQFCDDGFHVVSRSFDRFFNLGEMEDYYTDFVWENATAQEKMDGSLISIYWNPLSMRWEVSTSGTAFGESEIYSSGVTYRQGVLAAFDVDDSNFNIWVDTIFHREYTYIFEFVSPENRIVTPYKKAEMILLAVRNHATGEYNDTEKTDCYNRSVSVGATIYPSKMGLKFRLVEQFQIQSSGEIVDATESLTGLKEGFVVVDKNNKRIKIKNSQYLILHKLRGKLTGLTRRDVFGLILSGESEEYLSYFKEDIDMFDKAKVEIDNQLSRMDLVYVDCNWLLSDKDFANSIILEDAKSYMFSARKNKTMPSTEFKNSPIERRVKLFLK